MTIRYLPNDSTFIDVYVNDQFHCTAVPNTRLSQQDRKQIVRERNSQIRQTDRLVKRSSARAQRRELEGNPLASPERDPKSPARSIEDASEDDFLAFVEQMAKITKETTDDDAR